MVDAIGKSGGLDMLVEEGIDLEILGPTNHGIASKISNYSNDGNYFLLCIVILFQVGSALFGI